MPQPGRTALPAKKCDAVRIARTVSAVRANQRGKGLPHIGNARPYAQRSTLCSSRIGGDRTGLSVKQSALAPLAHGLLLTLMMYAPRMIFCVGVLAMMRTAGAMDIENPELIRAAAENAVRAEAGAAADTLTLQPAPLDSRLRIASCDRRLSTFLTGASAVRSQTTVGVRCEGSVRWTIYTSVNVQSQAKVLVARRSLARDAEATAADFRVEDRLVPGLASAYVSDPAALTGQRLGHPVVAGDPLTLETLAPANLIHRGQQVVVLAHAGGLEVRMLGVALSDGRESERIKVQNQTSQRIVEGIVRSANEVETPL